MVLLLCVLIAVIRLAGPSDLMDNEQQRQSAYVMDALQNHHWLIQKDGAGEIASKPPLYTWLAAGTSALWPHINRLGVCLPACCATTLLACIVFLAGATFGPTAGFLASIVYLLSMPVLRQIGMARMDALFPLTTTWGALAAYSAWVRGRGWVWFWLACGGDIDQRPAGRAAGGGGVDGGILGMGQRATFAPPRALADFLAGFFGAERGMVCRRLRPMGAGCLQ